MASLTIYAGLSYSNVLTTAAETGETTVQVVFAFERDSSPDRWKLEKTYTIANNSITMTLSASETAEYTHVRICEWYYVMSTTGSKRFGGTYDVNLTKIAGSRDTTSTIPKNDLSFVKFGQATTAAMQNSYTMTEAVSASKLTLTSDNAPLTTALIAEVYVDAAATGKKCTLAAGANSQTTTLTPALNIASGAVVTFVITQTGTAPDEGSNIIGKIWYY